MTLSGVRPEREVACEQYHRVERGHGSFSRTFHLPVPVDADGILADLRDGILTVTCPKANNVFAAPHSDFTAMTTRRLIVSLILLSSGFAAGLVIIRRM